MTTDGAGIVDCETNVLLFMLSPFSNRPSCLHDLPTRDNETAQNGGR